MTVYVKCHCCGKVVPISKAEVTQDYEDIEDIEDENVMCRDCFSNRQDTWAYNESQGEFHNYEDHMKYNCGATICGDYDTLRREY